MEKFLKAVQDLAKTDAEQYDSVLEAFDSTYREGVNLLCEAVGLDDKEVELAIKEADESDQAKIVEFVTEAKKKSEDDDNDDEDKDDKEDDKKSDDDDKDSDKKTESPESSHKFKKGDVVTVGKDAKKGTVVSVLGKGETMKVKYDDEKDTKEVNTSDCSKYRDKDADRKTARESVDTDKFTSLLGDIGVAQEKIDEFAAILKTHIVDVAIEVSKEYMAEEKINLEAEYAIKMDELDVRFENYAAKAAAEFATDNGQSMLDHRRLEMFEKLFESQVGLLNDFEFDINEENSERVENLKSELSEYKEAVDTATSELHEARQELLLERVENKTAELSRGMTESDQERFTEMLDEIHFVTAEEFTGKAESIRSKYFVETRTKKVSEDLSTFVESEDGDVITKKTRGSLQDALKQVRG